MLNNLHCFSKLKIKRKEINTIITILEHNSLSVSQQTILKSTIIMMAYNMVEGVFSTLISSLFDYIMDNNIPFEKLPKKMQKIYLSYHMKNIGNSIKKLKEFRSTEYLCNVSSIDFLKKEKLYSGNLDAKKIREISEHFGISISDSIQGKELLIIKNVRNKLAHGEKDYSVASRDFTVKEIKKIVRACYKFMLMCTLDFEKFVFWQLNKPNIKH